MNGDFGGVEPFVFAEHVGAGLVGGGGHEEGVVGFVVGVVERNVWQPREIDPFGIGGGAPAVVGDDDDGVFGGEVFDEADGVHGGEAGGPAGDVLVAVFVGEGLLPP